MSRSEPHVTSRQHEIMILVEHLRRQHGRLPTLTEVAAEMGLSKATVHGHYEQLTAKQLMTPGNNLSRSRQLTPAGRRHVMRAISKLHLLREAWRAASEEERKRFLAEVTR